MRIHFIAIGGSIMHSLAIALKQEGHQVTGSDDHIFDPARSRLSAHDLLPDEGWDSARITPDIEAVILGMHAFEDNPELKRAQELSLPIYSFPEFIYEHSKQKHRLVIAGSAGKTTVTSMIMHVLKGIGKDVDYLVGAQVKGFDNPVKLSGAPMLLVEGDEYLSSKLDPSPKFLRYHPHLVVLTNISWDHINVFPSEEVYIKQFRDLLESLEKAADVIYFEEDKRLKEMVEELMDPELYYPNPYKTPKAKVKNGEYILELEGHKKAIKVYGKHNLANIAAAWKVCELLSIEIETFLEHMATFEGAQIRLETLHEDTEKMVIRDYAHAPSKVKASVHAVKERYPKKNLIACLELHTFSSLNKSFLPHYQGTMDKADHALVYVNPKAIEKRRMEALSAADIQQAFKNPKLTFVESPNQIQTFIQEHRVGGDAILMMSSGDFGGMDLGAV
ncbi:MAG: Mur ligase family protein [Bacteroidota bacterium]